MRFTTAPFAIAIVTVLPVVSCAPSEFEQRCNSDIECPSRACVLGACVDRVERAAEPAPVFPVDDPNDPGNESDPDPNPEPEPEPDPVDPVECNSENGVIVFDDLDLDGHGAGPGRCVFEVGEGESVLGDDCDDSDWSVFALSTVFDDADGDGFTAGSRLLCASADEPGVQFAPNDAPVLLVSPNRVVALDGEWSGLVFDPVASSPVGVLEIGRFACAAQLPRVSGIEVRVAVDDLVNSGRNVALGVQLQRPDGALSTALFQQGAIDGTTTFTFGGPGDFLGLSDLTPEEACDPNLALHLTLDGAGTVTSLFAVDVQLSMFGVEDCDDQLAAAFSPASLKIDDDGDGAGDGFAVSECIGAAIPAGKAVRGGDCDPFDPRAFPGQEDMFTTPREGVGGFDFNCDGAVEKEAESVNRMVAGSCTFDGTYCNWTQNQVNPSCGASVTVFGYCQAGCHPSTFTQGCR